MGIFHLIVFIFISSFVGSLAGNLLTSGDQRTPVQAQEVRGEKTELAHWFLLHRKSNTEFLYYGTQGNVDESKLVRTFKVKTGVPGKKPTPLPQALGREYWVLIAEAGAFDTETAPYFLTLDVPVSDTPPYGPSFYQECEGQCNWEIPGFFGLHGTGGDMSKLSDDNAGSSGCIRHSDEDITYLYNLLDPTKEEIRYYIKDI